VRDEIGGSAYPWWLAQIAELLRRSEQHHLRALTLLNGVDSEIDEQHTVVLTGAETAELETIGSELLGLAEQLHGLTAELPARAIEITYPSIAARAGADLAAGIIDLERARLAASLLHVHDGWPALAHALTQSDAHLAWEDTTFIEFLTSFRLAHGLLVRRVLDAERLDPDTTFADSEPQTIARLATALEEHGLRKDASG
jgi:hypothetical protein